MKFDSTWVSLVLAAIAGCSFLLNVLQFLWARSRAVQEAEPIFEIEADTPFEMLVHTELTVRNRSSGAIIVADLCEGKDNRAEIWIDEVPNGIGGSSGFQRGSKSGRTATVDRRVEPGSSDKVRFTTAYEETAPERMTIDLTWRPAVGGRGRKRRVSCAIPPELNG